MSIRVGYAQIWLRARRDREHNLPSPRATALGETEKFIQSATNISIRALQDQHAKATEKLKTTLEGTINHLSHTDQPEFDRFVALTGRRQTLTSLTPLVHRTIMGLLAFGEAAFNIAAFSAFGEAMVATVLMGLSVAVAIPLLAFKTGLVLRQYRPQSRRTIWASSLALVALVTLIGINLIRVRYLEMQGVYGGDNVETTVVYLFVNLSVYVAAVVTAYLAIDPEEGFAEAKARADRAHERITSLKGRLNEVEERLKHRLNIIREGGAQAIAFYRNINRRGRRSVPRYFDDESAPNHKVTFAAIDPPQDATGQQRPASPASQEVPSVREGLLRRLKERI